MSLFAEINNDNIVVRVVVVEDGCDADWCREFFDGGTWIQTSEDGSIRANYAGVGYTYDPVNDVFFEPKPYDSWSFNAETYAWVPPVPHPNNGTFFRWDEDTLAWVAVE
jgi:hypothetical protein